MSELSNCMYYSAEEADCFTSHNDNGEIYSEMTIAKSCKNLFKKYPQGIPIGPRRQNER